MEHKSIAIFYESRETLLRYLSEIKFTFVSSGAGWSKTTSALSALEPLHPCYIRVKPNCTPRFSSREPLVILDDYHNLSPGLEQRAAGILRRSPNRQHFVILSRAPLPDYLLTAKYDGSLRILDASDLALDGGEILRLASERGISLLDDEVKWIKEYSQGCPVIVDCILKELSSSGRLDRKTEAAVIERLDRYLDGSLFREWTPDTRKLLLSTSYFDHVPPDLASRLTGRKWSEEDLLALQSAGVPITKESAGWSVTDAFFLVPYLRRKAGVMFPEETIRRIHEAGGSWYAERGDFERAYRCFQKTGDRGEMLNMLISNVRRDAGASSLYRLRDGYRSLNHTEARSSPELLYGMSRLCAMTLDADGAEAWYNELVRHADGPERSQVMGSLFLLDVILPRCNGPNLSALVLEARRKLEADELICCPSSLTSGLPSILRCGRDLSDPLLDDPELFSEEVKSAAEGVLGRHGVGLTELLQAELKLEKGEDISSLFLQWYPLQIRIRERGTLDTEFVCVALMVRSLCGSGQLPEAASFLLRFRQRAEAEGGEHLLPNIDAMRCRLSLLEDSPYAEAWLSRQGPPEQEIFLPDMYRLLTQVRCHIKRDEYPAALLLLGQMLDSLDRCFRPLCQIEVLTLIAVCCFRENGTEWREYLSKALALGARYGYTAVFEREGAALLPLLERYGRYDVPLDYWETMLNKVIVQSSRYPLYLKPPRLSMEPLTPREQTILHLILQGKSNEEIGNVLHIRPSTVKTHIRNLFVKLDVCNREQAREAAHRLRLDR